MLKPMMLDGETTDKFIMLDDNNNYLVAKILTSGNTEQNADNTANNNVNSNVNSNTFFYIVDSIISSNIINNKSNIPTTTPTIQNIENTTEEGFTNFKESFALNLDTSNNIPIYDNLFNPSQNIIMADFIQDNYSTLKNLSQNSAYLQIVKKQNDITTNKQLSSSLNKNQDEYNSINELNKEIEAEIIRLNSGLNTKNDIIINKLDKMRVSDLANDYFFLKYLPSV